jgi:ParB-like chromosome segregation protein Spo0J
VDFIERAKKEFKQLDKLSQKKKIEAINALRKELHKYSPFKNEPVDFVEWVETKKIKANDYNPNQVAPPEMKLLEHSIREDGYTQPIVVWPQNGHYEVIDGFHRNRVGTEIIDIKARIKNYLPVTIINPEREKRNDRIASTIRHNRARGKHTVEGMSDIVLELKNRNLKNELIARELGMDPDEILRLCQITGLAELFIDDDFSKSWDVENSELDDDFDPLQDEPGSYSDEEMEFRTVNTNDSDRIFHKWHKWECYKAGFYNTSKNGMTREQCEKAYSVFLSDTKKFTAALEHIITEWKYSCEHYLTNKSFNRIAWLGQAAMCYAMDIPATYRGGFYLLSEKQQNEANEVALIYLNKWLKANKRDEVDMETALAHGRQMELY